MQDAGTACLHRIGRSARAVARATDQKSTKPKTTIYTKDDSN